jgi:hypothetical protein
MVNICPAKSPIKCKLNSKLVNKICNEISFKWQCDMLLLYCYNEMHEHTKTSLRKFLAFDPMTHVPRKKKNFPPLPSARNRNVAL